MVPKATGSGGASLLFVFFEAALYRCLPNNGLPLDKESWSGLDTNSARLLVVKVFSMIWAKAPTLNADPCIAPGKPGIAPGKPGIIDPAAICALVAALFDLALLPVLAAVSAFVVELLLVAELLTAAPVVVAELLTAANAVVSELLSVATVVMAALLVAELMSPVPVIGVDLLADCILLTTELLTLLAKLLRLD